MSDHYAVFTVIDNNSRNRAKPHLVTIRDYKRFHLKNFLHDLSSSLSSTFTTYSTYHSVHTAWDKWKSVFLECSNHYAPLKTFRVSHVTSTFITPDIRQLIYHRDYLHSKAVKYSDELLWSEYRKIRNLITSQISKSKKQYFASRVLQSSGNMGQMWNTLKEALNKNTRDNSSTDLSPDDFNDYFSTIGTKIAETFNDAPVDTDLNNSFADTFTFSEITQRSIHQLLLQLGSSKSNLDILNMDSYLLYLAADVISPSLAIIFNLSCSQAEIPKDWKLGRVTPIYKNKGDRSDPANYRPISVISHIAKLMETCIKNQLVNFLNSNKLITPHQSAYLEKHSTITALHKMVDDWYYNNNKGLTTAVCFLDLTKCFDTVDHPILLSKLAQHGCCISVVNWFRSYLSHREQVVKYHSSYSKNKTVNIGVPQGSILGPILFLIFINDLPISLRHSSCCIYADDITLYNASKDLADAESKLQADLFHVVNWFKTNKLLLNTDKSKCMLIGTKANIKDNAISIKINQTALELVSSFKLLGLHIESHLSWKLHLEHLTKVLSPKVGMLCRLSKILPQNVLITLYLTIIQPHIDYAITLWGGSPNSYILPIQRLQNRAARSITRSFDRTASVSALLFNLKIMNVDQRYKYFTLNMVYKCLNDLCPSYLINLFRYVNTVHDRPTRSSSNNALYLPKPNFESFKNSFQYAGASLWNQLPPDLKNSTSLELFKTRYKKQSLYNSN